MPKFEREERYIVFKIKGLLGQQERQLADWITAHGIAPVECVVVEKDWPIYEKVWDLVEGVWLERQARKEDAERDIENF